MIHILDDAESSLEALWTILDPSAKVFGFRWFVTGLVSAGDMFAVHTLPVRCSL